MFALFGTENSCYTCNRTKIDIFITTKRYLPPEAIVRAGASLNRCIQGYIRLYLIFICILKILRWVSLAWYLIFKILSRVSWVSYLRYFFNVSSPTLLTVTTSLLKRFIFYGAQPLFRPILTQPNKSLKVKVISPDLNAMHHSHVLLLGRNVRKLESAHLTLLQSSWRR